MIPKDLASIDYESKFGDAIRNVFFDLKPKKIIETGLYYGNGSTRIITSLIKYIPIPEAKFISIECNKKNIEIAKANLAKLDLLQHVEIINALSIRNDMLPTKEKLEAYLGRMTNVKSDHKIDVAYDNYGKEIEGYEDQNGLYKAFQTFEFEPDFILLDSSGSLGWEEFWYVNFMLKSKCIIALDDILHVKHAKSYKALKDSGKYNILYEGDEKFGFCIAEFDYYKQMQINL